MEFAPDAATPQPALPASGGAPAPALTAGAPVSAASPGKPGLSFARAYHLPAGMTAQAPAAALAGVAIPAVNTAQDTREAAAAPLSLPMRRGRLHSDGQEETQSMNPLLTLPLGGQPAGHQATEAELLPRQSRHRPVPALAPEATAPQGPAARAQPTKGDAISGDRAGQRPGGSDAPLLSVPAAVSALHGPAGMTETAESIARARAAESLPATRSATVAPPQALPVAVAPSLPDASLPAGNLAGTDSIDAELPRLSSFGAVSAFGGSVSGGAFPSAAIPAGSIGAQDTAAVIRQIAQAVDGRRPSVIEIALSPPELGRVRMQLAPTETGLAVTVLAERAETAELLRRHGEDLLRDLRAAGHGAVTLDVAGSGTGSSSDRSDEQAANPGAETPARPASAGPHADPADTIGTIRLGPGAGLDMRL